MSTLLHSTAVEGLGYMPERMIMSNYANNAVHLFYTNALAAFAVGMHANEDKAFEAFWLDWGVKY